MRMKRENGSVYLILYLLVLPFMLHAQEDYKLQNENISLRWEKGLSGYKLSAIELTSQNQKFAFENVLGEYTVLFSKEKPSGQFDSTLYFDNVSSIPESYIMVYNRWKKRLSPVAMNTAGEARFFYPHQAKYNEGSVEFKQELDRATLTAVWSIDDTFKNDILLEIELTAKQEGYFSIQSPTLFSYKEEDISWGIVPGHFQGKSINDNLLLSYGYGQGIPNKPVIARERTASTLSPILSDKKGVSVAVIAQPGMGRDYWEYDVLTQNDWLLGLSLMNRKEQLFPTIHHPVLGEKDSYLQQGEKISFRFRYTLDKADWYTVYKHAVNDIYRFPDVLEKKKTNLSLTDRLLGMFAYLRNDSTSLWHTFHFKDLEIGAQEYHGPVVGSQKDAFKNSDYGAMWMLSHITKDSVLAHDRLPYARNFKIAQQADDDGFFGGAALGQYYLSKSNRFTEEWGDYVEPIALTYYTMLDIGNVLLFEPNDSELKRLLRRGADRLLSWQQGDGSWVVAYDHLTHKVEFQDLRDLRPTFYGLIVAYRILGDRKYLEAAEKGANWYIRNAVEEGHYLGVCGDFRFVPDFATGQSVQALLDLYDLTQKETYKTAALVAARQYTTSIFTHPIPSNKEKVIQNKVVKDWEISQVGLSFEHGGSLGSAAKEHGPILLASHAGMFVRLFEMTGDSLFIDMARAGVWGRDAFVNKENSVASYYWYSFDQGPGRFPHHAWWQIGWITDYLLSEIALRSQGKISFPRGFITPKVGPHQSYGFKKGNVLGKQADLLLKSDVVTLNNPQVDYFMAISNNRLYVLLLNNSLQQQNVSLKIDYSNISEKNIKPLQAYLHNFDGQRVLVKSLYNWNLQILATGLNVIEIEYR